MGTAGEEWWSDVVGEWPVALRDVQTVPRHGCPSSSAEGILAYAAKWRRGAESAQADQWIFRGQGNASYPPRSTLERWATACGCTDPQRMERAVLSEFKRRAHHYVDRCPDDDDDLEWLALLRHYGAPTRLLDATYSFEVALFFACEDALGSTTPAAVWAFNATRLRQLAPPTARRTLDKDRHLRGGGSLRTLLRLQEAFAVGVSAFRLNDRLAAQQGTFIWPGTVRKSFVENLAVAREKNGGTWNGLVEIILLAQDAVPTALRLLKSANITKAALYPGLVGFAESLRLLGLFQERQR